MDPIDRAEKYYYSFKKMNITGDTSKKCALMLVDEISEQVFASIDQFGFDFTKEETYWEQVKEEIKKL